jgi:hypothetical protein
LQRTPRRIEDEMKVWITKYALTRGIIARDAELCSERMIVINGRYPQYYHLPYWHRSHDEAVTHANKLLRLKLSSLRKHIAKLEKMTF